MGYRHVTLCLTYGNLSQEVIADLLCITVITAVNHSDGTMGRTQGDNKEPFDLVKLLPLPGCSVLKHRQSFLSLLEPQAPKVLISMVGYNMWLLHCVEHREVKSCAGLPCPIDFF